MDYTYVDYFNYYLKQFLNELINNYPDSKKPILANYRPLLENQTDKSDLYAKCYYTKINAHLEKIAKKDESLFVTPGVILIEGVDLHHIWKSSNCNEANKAAIWKYLQILMVLGRRLIPNHKEIIELLNKISAGEVAIPAKVEKTLETPEEEEKKEEGFGLGNLLNLASGLTGGAGGAGGAGGLLGSLGGLAGLGGLGDLAQGLGDLDLGKMMETLTSAMGQMMPPPSANVTAEGGDSATPSVTEVKEEAPSGSAEAGSAEGASGTNPAGVFGANSLFGDLAKEMTETLNFEELEKAKEDGQPPNIGEVFKKMMSGDNPAKLMNLVTKFGSRLQSDIASGKVSQGDLLKQTMGMMQNMQRGAGNPEEMARQAEQMLDANPQLRARFNNAQRQEAARSRLKEKLEKRQQGK